MLGEHSFGEELRACQLDGIRVSETLMPAGLHLQPHAHEPGQICFVLEGEYRENEHHVRPGTLLFHAPGETHANVFSSDDDALTLLVSIDPARWLRVAPLRPQRLLLDIADEIRRELHRGDDASRFALEGLAMLSLARLARCGAADPAAEPAWLHDAVSYIDRCYADPISLATIAASIGIHRATLAAAFRRFRSTSVGDYLRELRVRHAMRALAMTSAPLAVIAIEAGFHDQAHFGRVFRKIIGTTPGAYRRGVGGLVGSS